MLKLKQLISSEKNYLKHSLIHTDQTRESHSLDGRLHQEGFEYEDHAFDMQSQWRRKVSVSINLYLLCY